jgi:tetratricopeptide (TPR) repeat protein
VWSRQPDRPVIPVIIDGSPPDNFPPALRYELATDGTITDHPVTVLGPDLRDSGDGKSLGLAKVIAGLIAIGTDEVFRRAERARKRRNRFWGVLAGVFLVLALAASASAVYAWQQLKTNEAFLNATLKRATEIVNEAVTQAETYNVPRTATLALLGKAEGLFDDMAQYGRSTPELRFQRAWMLIQFANNYAILGDTSKQLARAKEAHRLLAGLVAEKPDEMTYQVSMSGALIEIGDVLMTQGNLTEAMKSYRDGLVIMEQLAKTDPDNAAWLQDLAAYHERIGNLLRAQGNLTEALKSYRDGLVIMERLAEADPNRKRALALDYERFGNLLRAQDNLPGALATYRHGVLVSLAGGLKVEVNDPKPASLDHASSVLRSKMGDVLMAQGDLTAAMKSYRDGFVIMEGLAKADPANAVWQHDLAVIHERVADLLLAQGNLTEALKSYRDGFVIMERLAEADHNNAVWLQDLAEINERLGDTYIEQKESDEAKAAFERALAIYDRLTAKSPDDTLALVNSTEPLMRLGELYGANGRAYLQKALAILKQFDEAGRLEPKRKSHIAWIERRLAKLEEAEVPRR